MVEKKQLVSIIVRTKDRPKLLKRALRSISSQTYRPIEVILVNDGGCDLPEDELKEILGDVSLHYIRFEENKGRSGAGNEGIRNAKGDYIGFLDDDDELYPEHLETLTGSLLGNKDYIAYTDCNIVHSGSEVIPPFSEKKKNTLTLSRDFSFQELLTKNFIPFMCILFPKNILNKTEQLDEKFELYEDWDLLIRLSEKYSFHHIKKTTAIYHIWDRNLQLTEYSKYTGLTGKAFSQIFKKHRRKYTHDTIQHLVREREAIAEREAHIRKIIAEKDSIIAEREAHIRKIIAEKDSIIAEREAHIRKIIAERDIILSEIYDSLSWRLLTQYRKIKNKIFPEGTRRRRFYDFGLKSTRVIRSEGLGRFYMKAKARLQQEITGGAKKKHEYSLSTKIKQLKLPGYDTPEVSIIIPVFNKSIYTYNCIESILRNTHTIKYEVLVINNASTDDTKKMLKMIVNLNVIHIDSNKGFIHACNTGAEMAKGEYLVLLNNDTKVTYGWLEALLEPVKNNSTGIVGAKLIYPNGKLQEAGGIVWKDGSAWNYGKFDDPEKYEYNYLREVDYCSGACILIKKSLFEDVGGLDSRYAPAYYEDTDLSFTLRMKGFKTVYQPKAEIIHFEGVTAGTDTDSGVKRFQESNRKIFVAKHKDIIQAKHLPNGQDIFLARNRSYKSKNRILYVDHYVPACDKDAGSVRTYEYLKIFLSLGFQITFWPDNLARMEPYTGKLQAMGIEVVYGNEKFDNFIDKFGKYFHVAFLSRPHIAIKYINHIKSKTDMKIIYDCHDLGFLRELRRAEVESNEAAREQAVKLKKDEIYLCSQSNAVVVLSSYERDLLLKEYPDLSVYLIPLVYPVPELQVKEFLETQGLLFIGGFVHPPNENAVLWFVNEVLPFIHRELPDVHFSIIGSNPSRKILRLASDKIRVIGYVKDVTGYFQDSRIFVAPLQFGAGAKGKIIQSMSYGLPVVTTSVGAEGLDFTEGMEALVADEPSEFARKVIDLYTNDQLWNTISRNSRMFMKNNLSSKVAYEKFQIMFAELSVSE